MEVQSEMLDMDMSVADTLEGSLSAMRKQQAAGPDVFSLLCFCFI